MGLVIQEETGDGSPTTTNARYAMVAGGAAALVGIDKLTLQGSLSARVNRMGAPVNHTINVHGTPVPVIFDSAMEVTEVSGSAKLSIADFVSIEGTFAFTKENDTILVGVSNVNAFLGATNDGQPIGLKISDGNLGLVLHDGKYALKTSGRISLVGLDGMAISGGFAVSVNKLGTPVDRTIAGVNVRFDTGTEETHFGGNATISIAGVFELRGEVSVTKTKTGVLLVDVPSMALEIASRDLTVFEIGGRARFGIGGGRGFRLLDVGITEVTVLGVSIVTAPGNLPTLAPPSDEPIAAQLTTITDGIDATLLNSRKYLDITFDSPTDEPLDMGSIMDPGAEFTLSGAGVADVEIIGTPRWLEGNTFRYELYDKNMANETSLFRPGEISVVFLAGSWTDESGVPNAPLTDTFKVNDGKASTQSDVKLGPLSLSGPYFAIEDLSFDPMFSEGKLLGAMVTITVGLGVDSAMLAFNDSEQGITASLAKLRGAFDLMASKYFINNVI